MGVSCNECGSTVNFCQNCGKPIGVAKKEEPKKEAPPPKKEEPKKEEPKKETPPPKKEEPKKEEPKKEAPPPKKEEPKKEAPKKETPPPKKEEAQNGTDDTLWLFLITILTVLMGIAILSMFQDDLTFLDAPPEKGSSHIQDLYRDLR